MSSSSILHPNLFQVFHPICGVRASPLSYPTTALDSKSSKPRWLGIELRNFMAEEEEGADGTRAVEAVSWFYAWQVTVEKDPRVSWWPMVNVIGTGTFVAPTQEVWVSDLRYCGAANPFKRKVRPRTMMHVTPLGARSDQPGSSPTANPPGTGVHV